MTTTPETVEELIEELEHEMLVHTETRKKLRPASTDSCQCLYCKRFTAIIYHLRALQAERRWRKWPEEKPECFGDYDSGLYLVTCVQDGRPYSFALWFDYTQGDWEPDKNGRYKTVISWSELPPPWTGEG